MSMPKASMHKNAPRPAAIGDIRAPGEARRAHTEPYSERVQNSTHSDFRRGIPHSNLTHNFCYSDRGGLTDSWRRRLHDQKPTPVRLAHRRLMRERRSHLLPRTAQLLTHPRAATWRRSRPPAGKAPLASRHAPSLRCDDHPHAVPTSIFRRLRHILRITAGQVNHRPRAVQSQSVGFCLLPGASLPRLRWTTC